MSSNTAQKRTNKTDPDFSTPGVTEPGDHRAAVNGDVSHLDAVSCQYTMLGYGGFDLYGFYLPWGDLPFETPGLDPLMLEAPKVELNPPPYSPSFYGSQFINDEELKQHPSADDDGYTADASAISSSPSLSTESDSPRLFSSPMGDESDDSSMSPSPPPAPTTAAWDYESLLRNTEYDQDLTTTLYEIFDTILDGKEPSKEQAKQFLKVSRGRFYCAVQGCKWHSIGWKREDRGVTHFKKEHLRLLKYPCSDCDQVYKWPHDLTAHRRRQHLKLPQELYVCTECGSDFPKSFNLSRHQRNVHGHSKKKSRSSRLPSRT